MSDAPAFTLREDQLIRSEAELRERFGDTHKTIYEKSSARLTPPMRRFIELAPFCCISSHDADGRPDLSPRGDAPGFVAMPDDRTLLIPDRPGNQRYDTIRNVLVVPQVSLIFMIPGVFNTLRVSGRARASRDPALLSRFAVRGKEPLMVLAVTVEEAFGHCSKAIRRAALWSDEHKIEHRAAPSLAEMMADHMDLSAEDYSDMQDRIRRDLQTKMY